MTRTGTVSEAYDNSKVYGTHYPDGTTGTFTCETGYVVELADGSYSPVTFLIDVGVDSDLCRLAR